MTSSKTSLNGYKYGREPETETPFWGGESAGAEIDDSTISTVKTWSSKKISDELAEKADADDVYTKAEVDEMLEDIPAIDAYTKTETDELLAGKAAVTSVYTKAQTYSKTEVDNLLSQIPAVDAYTKAQTDSLLDAKADASSVYTKTETDTLLATKAGLNAVYTKGQTDRLLTDKANTADVYTKSQTDGLLADKADVTDLADYAKATSVYTKAQTYTKQEVDDLIQGGGSPVDAYTKAQTDALLDEKANASDVYTKTQTNNLLADKANASDVYTKSQTDNLLADKANASDVYTKSQTDNLLADCAKATSVYTKTQTYTKAEVDSLISQAGGGAEIDDNNISSTTTWSSDKIDSELIAVNNHIQDSVVKFIDTHGLFRYSGLYGSDTALEDGELYNITGSVIFRVDGNDVYQGTLEGIPYNDLASGATQENILGTAGYLWKDWVITETSGTGLYYEIPVKIAFIGQTSVNGKYNPYIHIIYNYQSGHTISFVCRATDYTKVPSSGGGGGLQEYEYTIATPSSTSIADAIMASLADAITNVGVDNLEKLRKIVARTQWTYNGSTPNVKERIYDVKSLDITKGGGNFDDITLLALGGDDNTSSGDVMKTTKFIANRYFAYLTTVEQSGTNPIVIATDRSSTNVGDNTSPWYHNVYPVSEAEDLLYKIVFVYG